MAEGGTIYTKTIDPSVQDGIDKNLIIQPNYAYQKKFGFGDDWNEIKIGMFLSYTNSVTNDNAAFVNGQSNVFSGNTNNDTYSYFGIIEDSVTKFLPGDSGGGSFIGRRWNTINDIKPTDAGGGDNAILSDSRRLYLSTNNDVNQIDTYSTRDDNSTFYSSFYTETTTNFSGYTAMNISIINKGLSNQSVEITVSGGKAKWPDNVYTDISLNNLKSLINDSARDFTTITLDFNDSGTPLNIPDSLFFYNAFLKIRPRIHAIAVKKIS